MGDLLKVCLSRRVDFTRHSVVIGVSELIRRYKLGSVSTRAPDCILGIRAYVSIIFLPIKFKCVGNDGLKW